MRWTAPLLLAGALPALCAPEPAPAADPDAQELDLIRKQIFERRVELMRNPPPPAPAPAPQAAAEAPPVPAPAPAAEENREYVAGTLLVATDMPAAPDKVVADAAPAPVALAPSQNVTINLINRLVQRGVLTQEDAQELIRQAEADALEAREQAVVAAASAPRLAAPDSANEDGSFRVTYVPQFIRNQMAEEIRQQVMEEAAEENWAAPQAVPEWLKRISLFGDVRTRYQGDFMSSDNATGLSSNFFNYNAINTSSTPYDFTGTALPPYHNVDQDRNRARLRARFGAAVDLTAGFSAGLRGATGDSNSPVSPNQSLGAAGSGQGGNFSKYAVWLDRAFIKYELGGSPGKNLAFTAGRFDNPFFGTDIIWDDDLGFDGLAASGRYEIVEGVTPFITGGAFPVFNTDFNFSSNQPTKFKSHDKWLYAGQAGVDWKINKDVSLKVAGAYYDFENVEGEVSSPFVPLTSSDAGDTDHTRPSFAQKGNTYIALREIEPDPSNGFGTTNQWQYFGLATPYRLAAATARLDLNSFDPFHIWLVGEAVVNTAFNKDDINNNGPSNLRGPVNNLRNGSFEGGDLGWTVRLNLGKVVLEELWDWNINFGYRYVESDAVVDGLTDSDFGGGGSNLEGFTVGGNLAFSRYIYSTVRWMSADNIDGPTFKEDVIQVELNAKF